MTDFIYRKIENFDFELLKVFLKENFFNDEPLSKIAGTIPTDKQLDKLVSITQYGCSTVTIDPEGNVAGVRLAYPRKPEDIEQPSKDRKNNKIRNFLGFLAFSSDVFKKFNVDTSMCGVLICVARKYRGHGIALKLYLENMNLAKSLGYPIYVCECTSMYSSKLCQKLEMTNVFEVCYNEYCDENGDPFFQKLPPPHDIAQVYVKVL